MAYYRPCSILEAIYDFNDQSREYCQRNVYQTYSPSFLIVLAACYSGDVVFLRQALNDERVFRENAGYHDLVSSCLSMIAQRGYLRVTQYLLGSGFDVNHTGIGNRCAVVTAAREGNQQVLKLLLRPEYGLKRTGDRYMSALEAAADHHESTTRLENVKTLYVAAEELPQPRTRENLLFRACRSDDMALARWLVADGPVDMYSRMGTVHFKSQSTLHWLAQQGKFEWVQWFLQVQPPRIFENDRHKYVMGSALNFAASWNHRETFFEIARFFEHDHRKLVLRSAAVENGFKRLIALLPSLDLQVILSQEAIQSYYPNVGYAALCTAISKGRSSNVQMLLERGVRTVIRVLVHRHQYERYRTSFSAMKTMLIKHGNPVFRVFEGQIDAFQRAERTDLAGYCWCQVCRERQQMRCRPRLSGLQYDLWAT